MQKPEGSQKLLLAYSSFMALSAFLVLTEVISLPSEPGNAVLFGLSALRLMMAVGVLIVLMLYSALTFKAVKDRTWAGRILEKWFGGTGISRWVAWLSGIFTVLGWTGCLLPPYRAGTLENYWVRGQPVMALILLLGLSTGILYVVTQGKLAFRSLNLAHLGLGLPLFIPLLFLLAAMFYTGFGVRSPDDFWYGAGVPVLTAQLTTAIIGGVLFLHFGTRWKSKRADVLICILLFILTAFVWAREPLNKSFMFTSPSIPNQEFYPFADSATFDAASQFPLIGEKLFAFNSVFFERPLYLSFLVFLHSVFGQDYETLMAVQAALFAVLPVIIYLIGASLDLRAAGLGAAIAAMFRGINSIRASNMIDMANPKMILTDFPAAIGIALVILVICEWLKDPERNRHYPAWIGGTIGLTLMLRTNALLLLIFLPFFVFFRFPSQWKKWFVNFGLIILGVMAITLPWEIRNLSLGGQMYSSIVVKFQNVIQQRYQSPFQPESSLPQDQALASTAILSTRVVLTPLLPVAAMQDEPPCDKVTCFSANHFLHNVLTSFLVLPTSPMMDDVRYLVRERYPEYWKAEWDGAFTDAAPLFLTLNLFIVTTGIAFAWRKKRLAGLAPLAIFVAYNLSNALARTSGGRYIVPADWIIPLYYFIGVIYIFIWLGRITGVDFFSEGSGQDETLKKASSPSSKLALVFAILLGFGSLIPLAENLHQPRYRQVAPMETLLANRSRVEAAGMDLDNLDKFLRSPGAVIIEGRALYPRFYKMNQGEITFVFHPYVVMGFPRTGFKLIGPAGEYSIVLPGEAPEHLPHASDVLVLGCNGQNYLDALVVIVLDDRESIYARQPYAGFECPLPEPVCNNNSVCQ